jgi:hypothetical protein
MANIGREHIQHLARKGHALQRRLDSIRDRLEGATTKLVRTVTVAAAAGVGGVIQGKAGPDGATIMHVPVDLGFAFNVAGYFNAAGKHSDHLNNIGDGLLACYVSSVGFGMGNTWRTTGKMFGSKGGGGALPPGGGSPAVSKGELSPAQMADIVARVRAASVPG